MKDSYIKLPIVKKIEVRGYGLFRKPLEYTFKKGLNLFIGGNRQGKTTTMHIILYALIGLHGRSKDFFSSRVKEENLRNNTQPRVKLDFQIAKTNIEIERDLFDPRINYFAVDGRSYKREDDPDIEGLYAQEIVKLAGISDLEDYNFLLEKLLIREEEGNYLLWNTNDQMRVLRLLFSYGRFDEQFLKLRENLRKTDSKVRGQQDNQAQVRKRQRAVEREKSESISGSAKIDPAELKKSMLLFQRETASLKATYEKVTTSIGSIEDSIKKTTESVSGLSDEIEELDSQIIGTENRLFQSVYTDPKIKLANHKLKNYHICIFCNNKIPKDKVQEIVSDIESKRRCPVCESTFTHSGASEITEEDRKKLIKLLLANRSEAEERRSQLSAQQTELETLKTQLKGLWEQESRLKEEIREKILETDDIKLQLSSLEMGSIEETSVFDRRIEFLQSQIDIYQKDIDKAKIEREKAREILERKNREFNKRLEEIKDGLVEIFKEYTKSFLGECKLVPVQRKTDESMIYVNVFEPEFAGRIRSYKFQVSNSEATFLEYSFRMSLCQLFKRITGGESLLAFETSEGLFDIGSVPVLAEAISRYYDVSYLLIISNLGKSDFLPTLVDNCKDKIHTRVLNYFDIGWLSAAQEKDRKKFDVEIRKILKD
jgi:DNA repair exonuclease SbcCD ATPase subunit